MCTLAYQSIHKIFLVVTDVTAHTQTHGTQQNLVIRIHKHILQL
jgi:hypothetical protein